MQYKKNKSHKRSSVLHCSELRFPFLSSSAKVSTLFLVLTTALSFSLHAQNAVSSTGGTAVSNTHIMSYTVECIHSRHQDFRFRNIGLPQSRLAHTQPKTLPKRQHPTSGALLRRRAETPFRNMARRHALPRPCKPQRRYLLHTHLRPKRKTKSI